MAGPKSVPLRTSLKFHEVERNKDFKLEHAIRVVLSNHPSVRNDIDSLIAYVWHMELQSLSINSELTCAHFMLSAIAKGKVTPVLEILDCAQQVMHHNPQLRGDYYIPTNDQS